MSDNATAEATEKRTRNTWSEDDVKALLSAVEGRGENSMESVFATIAEGRGVQPQAVRAKFYSLNGNKGAKGKGKGKRGRAAQSPAAQLQAAATAFTAAVDAVVAENAAMAAKIEAIRSL